MNRVIPRDLFNDANLLMNLGKLYLKLESLGLSDNLESNGQQYDIYSDIDGETYVDNITLSDVNGDYISLQRPLNSRDTYSLQYYDKANSELKIVFTDDGELTEHFVAYLHKGKENAA